MHDWERPLDRPLRHGGNGGSRHAVDPRLPPCDRASRPLGRVRLPLRAPFLPLPPRCPPRPWGNSVREVRPALPGDRGPGRRDPGLAHMQRLGIVGGGMLGLTLAHRFAAAGHEVTLFEGAPELGGLASPWSLGDVVWDRHYHVTLLSDSFLRGLLRELGLEDDMRWVTTRTGFFCDGRLYSLSNSLEFLKFPPLGLLDKARLAMTILYAARVKNWRRLE